MVVPHDATSVLWPSDLPATPGSMFVPPRQWYHQHFNVGAEPARYFAMARPADVFDTDEDNRKEIPYSEEDPKIREYFEAEVAHPLMQGAPNMAQLVLAVAIDFARTRGLGDLTTGRPKLAAWHARVSALPSIQATATR